jgi:hypothetical protein
MMRRKKPKEIQQVRSAEDQRETKILLAKRNKEISGYANSDSLSEWEKRMRKKGWYRRAGDYGSEVVSVSIPFQPGKKKEVVLNKYRYLSAPSKNPNTEFRFTESTPVGEPGRFNIECVRSGEFTHKGVPCHLINRSEKRGGIPMDKSEFKPMKFKKKRKSLGKPVDMRNFRR